MSPCDSFFQHTGKIIERSALFGGDINQVTHLKSARGDFVLKENRGAPDDFFRAEAAGLQVLKEAGLEVPEVVAHQKEGLLLVYIPRGRPDQASAGVSLARLHLQQQESFGFAEDNYIGSLSQKNGKSAHWAPFYARNRIAPQVALYRKKKPMSAEDIDFWERFNEYIENQLPEPEHPALIHGDLWSGNLYDGADGPVFIDPAVYIADRRVELAFTELFGGFGREFYDAYNSLIRFPDEVYLEFRELYQVYPLLVHANLFGGGYYNSALQKARKYIPY